MEYLLIFFGVMLMVLSFRIVSLHKANHTANLRFEALLHEQEIERAQVKKDRHASARRVIKNSELRAKTDTLESQLAAARQRINDLERELEGTQDHLLRAQSELTASEGGVGEIVDCYEQDALTMRENIAALTDLVDQLRIALAQSEAIVDQHDKHCPPILQLEFPNG